MVVLGGAAVSYERGTPVTAPSKLRALCGSWATPCRTRSPRVRRVSSHRSKRESEISIAAPPKLRNLFLGDPLTCPLSSCASRVLVQE